MRESHNAATALARVSAVIAVAMLPACSAIARERQKDAGVSDTATASDSHTSSDGGGADSSTLTAGTCGGQICYAGQSCVANQCSFTTCSGAAVPGDYATIQAAINALTNNGGSGTICLAAQSYAENLSLITGSVTIQGVSASQSKITGLEMTYAFEGNVGLNVVGAAISSLRIQPSANPSNGSASFTACSIGTFAIGVGGGGPDTVPPSLTLALDGVDLSSGSNTAAAMSISQGYGTFSLTMENSYIHDSDYGVQYTSQNESTANPSLTFLNNTFENNATALATPEGCVDDQVCGAPTVSYYNNLFVDNTLAIDTEMNDVITEGNNALFGNTTSYAGIAVAGSGYVTADPLLDTSTTPPGLKVGSPCRGAGNAAHTSPHDFWGRPRGATIDIGAVQSSP